MKENKRGGARPGAGRKRLDPGKKKVVVSLSVSGEVAKMLRELRASDYPVNEVLKRTIMKSHRACTLLRFERLDLDSLGIIRDISLDEFADSE